MQSITKTCFRGTLGLALCLLLGGSARADEPAAVEGIEPLARGPVHEAYALPAETVTGAMPLIAKQPPAAIEETPPDEKPVGDVLWIPGYWSWDQDRSDFIWVSGFWRVPPPGRQWMSGHWQQAGDQWQWAPGMWAAADAADVQFLPPPPEAPDAAPSVPAPDETNIFVPGTWVYRETRYLWRPGFWHRPRLGWVWVPAYYAWTPAGYLFNEGYWDYPLAQRGILFAPTWFDRRVYLRSGFNYRPSFVVNTDFLFGSLFVRSGYGSYYFGDYFDAGYRRSGFTPWFDHRVNRYSYDPLYSYYRGAYAGTPAWDRDMRSLYRGRFAGDIALPPRTLVQQTKLIQNITNNTNNTTNNVTNIKNVTVLSPLNQLDSKVVKLEAVTKDHRDFQIKSAQQFLKVADQRRLVETKLLTSKGAPIKLTDKPMQVKLELPKVVQPGKTTTTIKPPPLPTLPKHEDRPITKTEPIKPTPPKKEIVTPPSPKKDVTPPPPKKELVTPPPPKKDVTPPPPKKDVTPPPPRTGIVIPPPPPKKDVTPPPPKKEIVVPPPPKKDVTPPPPPKKDVTPPPPPPKKESPPPPKKDAKPPSGPQHNATPPRVTAAAPARMTSSSSKTQQHSNGTVNKSHN